MSQGDFLRRNAQTLLRNHYSLGGAHCEISTNSELILNAACACFGRIDSLSTEPKLTMRFWVDQKGTSRPPWPKPFFRGVGHLIFAGFDLESSVMIDLRSRRAIGRFSPAMGADRAYWKRVILPALVSIMGPTMGITELHCGCVAKGGNGILLAGPSTSGKSTLALAMTQLGFGYVSDDRTFCSEKDSRLVTWGLPTALKLRPPSAEFFQEFRGRDPDLAPNGEQAFLIDPDSNPGINRVRCCKPRWLVLLERQKETGFDFAPMSSAKAARWLEQDLIAEAGEVADLQYKTIANLVTLPCWKLRHEGRPQSVARELARRFENGINRVIYAETTGKSAMEKRPQSRPKPHDPLRRFTPTPLLSDLPVMGRTIRLETNSLSILQNTRSLFARYEPVSRDQPDFHWKIVCEPSSQKSSAWPAISAFSGGDLRFVSIGQRGFFAINHETRQAAGYLAGSLAEDEAGFVSPFLSTLFCLNAAALRLIPLAAACVTKDKKGLLVLGMPNSGKTTSSYLAAKSGLGFYSDRAVFLDLDEEGLRAWADFVPASFRMETCEFLPELLGLGYLFHYHDRTLLFLDTSTSIPCNGYPVVPVSCVFLERGVAKAPRLAPLNPAESYQRLQQCLPFEDDEVFEARYSAALSALSQVPACSLRYGDDPAEAATFFPSLLAPRNFIEGS